MRQNLTNVKEIDIKDVEHFYVVGSTTKEGLIEGKSNVKLDLKKAVSEGGGTSSEDAEKMYEALFGQVPYLPVESEEEVVMVPLYEFFTTDIGADTERGTLYYKSSTPVPKATEMYIESSNGSTALGIYFPMNMGIYMMEIPPVTPDTWYMPIPYDVNLIDYTTPTKDNPTTVSGTLPEKSVIEVLVNVHPFPGGEGPTEKYYWDDGEHAFKLSVSDSTFYVLKQSDDNVIEWSYKARIE